MTAESDDDGATRAPLTRAGCAVDQGGDAEGPTADFAGVMECARATERFCRWQPGARQRWRIAFLSLPLALLLSLAMAAVLWSAGPPYVAALARRWREKAVSLWAIRSDDEKDIPASRAECAFDTPLGSLYLGRAGLEIRDAVETCGEVDASANKSAEMYREAGYAAWQVVNGRVRGANLAVRKAQARSIADDAIQQAHAALKKVGDCREQMRIRWSNRTGLPLHHRDAPKTWEDVLKLYSDANHYAKRRIAYQRNCATLVSGTIASFGFSSAFLSAAVTECPSMFEQRTWCAADTSRLLASIGEMAAGSAAISAECTDFAKYLDPDNEFNRRLSEEKVSEGVDKEKGDMHAGKATDGEGTATVQQMIGLVDPESEEHEGDEGGDSEELRDIMLEKAKADQERQVQIAECTIDVSQGTLWLGKFGTDINAAVIQCAEHHMKNCGASTWGAIESLAQGAVMFSNAAIECPEDYKDPEYKAWCSSSISELLAGIAGLTSGIAAAIHVCTPEDVDY
mmetsp:Transcript_125126/g.359295  ORF Transcript_125126/g.359295 Transcript_125126/m.359295 type:complete len:513 (-) Transcript_125126:82-1620(-)